MEDDTPRISFSDQRLWDKLAEKRDRKGADWCKESGFGSERRSLDRAQPADVITLAGYDEHEREVARVREEHRAKLAGICKKCGRCDLAG